MMVCEHLRANDHFLERDEHLLQRHLRQQPHDFAVLELGAGRPVVALQARQLVDVFRGAS